MTTRILIRSLNVTIHFLLIICGLAISQEGYTQTGIQNDAKALLGHWWNPDKTKEVNFYEEDGQYFGVIVSVRKGDKVKPGDVIFKNLKWNGERFRGKIETPRGTANCSVTIINESSIAIDAQKGFASRQVYWTRME